jgi:hypothetical protein
LRRVFHPYHVLEETHAGLWRITTGEERKRHVLAAARLMADPPAFKAAMAEALLRWPMSCEHNLSAEALNRIAWLGHAGCCVGRGCPEEATRAGWHTLTPEQQSEANRVAGEVLAAWIEANAARLKDDEDELPLLHWGQCHAA